jgi:predicted transcriptional regulator YdeE
MFMKTELVHLDSLLLGGVGFYGDPFTRKGGWDSDNEIGSTCRRFVEIFDEPLRQTFAADMGRFYEVHVYGNETAGKGYFEVFAGMEVTTAELPVTLCTKYIAASDYLRATLTGQEISSDWWKTLETEIMTQYGVKRKETYILQVYDDRFKGTDQIETSEIEAYIPVEKK